MAERRMFAKTIIDSDAFLDMPSTTQNLYFHLGMRADDEGVVNAPKSIMRMIGAKEDDLSILIAKKFIIPLEGQIIVIKHWKINNYLRNDRLTESKYHELIECLEIDEKGAYKMPQIECSNNLGIPNADICLPNAGKRYPQDSIGKDSIDKNNIEKESIKEKAEAKTSTAHTPKHKHGVYGWIQLTDEQYSKLQQEYDKEYLENMINALDDYVQSNGNKNKYKDFNLVLRKALREGWFKLTVKTSNTRKGWDEL